MFFTARQTTTERSIEGDALNRWIPWAACLLSTCLLSTPALAITMDESGRDPASLGPRPSRSFDAATLNVTPSLQLSAQRDVLLMNRLASFTSRHGNEWDIRWDTRANRAAVVQGIGIPLLPGKGSPSEVVQSPRSIATLAMDDVAEQARQFIMTETALLAATDLELRLDAERSVSHGDQQQRWFLEFGQYHHGVRVDGAFIYVRIVHGNIFQFGAERVGNVVIDATPATSRDIAFSSAWEQLGFPADTLVSDWIDSGELRIYPTLPAGELPGSRFAGPSGSGYDHMLAWRYVFRTAGSESTWQVLVDAHSNQVIDVRDLNVHADATVSGGVYPTTNTDPEIVVEFPYTAVTNNGAQVTDAFGVYDYTGGNATSTLDGRYFRMVDNCGSISLSNATAGNLAFGASGGTDCATPGVGGAGNTHASRTGFYHLTQINEKARTFLPSNTWLQSKVTANMNINNTCNAFWNGTSVNFYRSGGGCSNTGELAAVFLHEWGHGMDSNSGGSANENGSGEALGDTFAFLETRDSCIGPNFRPGVPCRNCTSCTGVRDMADFSLGGARTIATPANVTSNTGIDCDALIGAGGISCPYTHPTSFSPYRGPMGYEGHCESYIASGSTWDLTQKLIDQHGESGWAEMDNIWYASLVPSKSAYRVESGGQCNTSAVVNGCGGTNWYTVFLAADDDDGNLANGTPNACLIWDAFSAHGIACGSRPQCTPQEIPDFSLAVTPASQSICAGDTAIYGTQVDSLFAFDEPVTLSLSGQPAGATVAFMSNPVTPGNASTLSITTSAGTAAGNYPLVVAGAANGSGGHTAQASLVVDVSPASAPLLTLPLDGSPGLGLRVDFAFQPVAGATSYTVEVASDAAFETIVASASGLTTTFWTSPPLAANTAYFWRATAVGDCGPARISQTFSFTTVDAVCSTPKVSIPDNNTVGVTDTLDIDEVSVLGGLRVLVDAGHTRVGDLVMTLSNGDRSVVLLDRPGVPVTSLGCLADDIDATFEDDASGEAETMCNPAPPAIAGSVRPLQALDTRFAGESFAGTWTLTVADRAGTQTGTLVNWCLQAKPAEPRSIGGTVNGLLGENLSLSLNGGEALAIPSNGPYTFETPVADGETFDVTVLTQPEQPNQNCTIAQASGTVAGADVDDIVVTCATLSYPIGGTVQGLSGSGLTLLLNESMALPVTQDGEFAFPLPLADGSHYDIGIASQPIDPTQECTLGNAQGNVDGAAVTEVTVTCIDAIDDTIFDDGFEDAP